MNSIERVKATINLEKPDRIPIFDMLRNDAAIAYYGKQELNLENAESVTYRATKEILDATRSSIKWPVKDENTVLEDGRKKIQTRWTTWCEHLRFNDEEEYARYLKYNYIESGHDEKSLRKSVQNCIDKHTHYLKYIGDTCLFWSISGVGLLNLYGEVGLDQFSYYLYDCPDSVSQALEAHTVNSIRKVKLLDEMTKGSAYRPLGVFIAEDIACNGSTIFSPEYLRREFFPRLSRLIQAIHEAGWKVVFHSDGNIMSLLDDLVEAGVDIINPIEVGAGMDIKGIHKRYPNLVMTGGIDASNLLVFGKTKEIKEAVNSAIEDAEGRILIGSSTEMHHTIPLKNIITTYDAVMNYRI